MLFYGVYDTQKNEYKDFKPDYEKERLTSDFSDYWSEISRDSLSETFREDGGVASDEEVDNYVASFADKEDFLEEQGFVIKEMTVPYVNIVLIDDNSPTGGVSQSGETLGDFLIEIDRCDLITEELNTDNKNEINLLLSESGIKQIENWS